MKNRIAVYALTAVVIVTVFMSVMTPALARTVNTDSWISEMGPPGEEELPDVECNLLREDGQTVMLSFQRNATIDLEFRALEDTVGSITVTSDPLITASVPLNTFRLNAGEISGIAIDVSVDSAVSPDDVNSPESLGFDVVFESGTVRKTAHFEMTVRDGTDGDETPNGEIRSQTEYYSPQYPVVLEITGPAKLRYTSAENDRFPPLTAFNTGEGWTVLYNGGFIRTEGECMLLLDLSKTGITGQLGLRTDATTVFELTPVDPIDEVSLDGLLVTGEQLWDLNLPAEWGGITPTVSFRRLITGEDDVPLWARTEKIGLIQTERGTLAIDASSAQAGTYKVIIEWINNGFPLYSVESTFFVMHNKAW